MAADIVQVLLEVLDIGLGATAIALLRPLSARVEKVEEKQEEVDEFISNIRLVAEPA